MVWTAIGTPPSGTALAEPQGSSAASAPGSETMAALAPRPNIPAVPQCPGSGRMPRPLAGRGRSSGCVGRPGGARAGGRASGRETRSLQHDHFLLLRRRLAKVPPHGAPLNAVDVLAAQHAVRRVRPHSPATGPAPWLELDPDPAVP